MTTVHETLKLLNAFLDDTDRSYFVLQLELDLVLGGVYSGKDVLLFRLYVGRVFTGYREFVSAHATTYVNPFHVLFAYGQQKEEHSGD